MKQDLDFFPKSCFMTIYKKYVWVLFVVFGHKEIVITRNEFLSLVLFHLFFSFPIITSNTSNTSITSNTLGFFWAFQNSITHHAQVHQIQNQKNGDS